MKNIMLSISFFLFMQAITFSMPNLLLGGGPGSHDTLILDGESTILHSPFDISYLGCEIRVRDAHCFKGFVLHPKVYTGCGSEDNDTVWEVDKEVEIKAGDLLQSNSAVWSFCKNAYATIDIIYKGLDGQKDTLPISMGNGGGGGGINLPDLYRFCYNLRSKKNAPQDKIELKEGKIFLNLGKNLQRIYDDAGRIINDIGKGINDAAHDIKVMTVNTVRTITSHNGTQFSVEIVVNGTDTSDVIKVYEGSVTVQLANPQIAGDKKAEIEQAGKDLQAGKITMQEFGQKMKEFQKANAEFQDLSKPVTVTEGNKCTATNTSIKIEPIESGDDHWWEHLK